MYYDDDDDNDPDRWCPLSHMTTGDALPVIDVWPTPAQAAIDTSPDAIEYNLNLVEGFDPACDRANIKTCGREFCPDHGWLLRYAAELRRIRDAV